MRRGFSHGHGTARLKTATRHGTAQDSSTARHGSRQQHGTARHKTAARHGTAQDSSTARHGDTTDPRHDTLQRNYSYGTKLKNYRGEKQVTT